MAVALANSNKAWAVGSSQASTIAVAFPNPVTAGNVLVVGAGVTNNYAGADATRWSSSPANTFAFGYSSPGPRLNVSYVQSAVGGSTTVTFTLDAGASDYSTLAIAEFSGIANSNPVDNTGYSSGTTGTNPNVPAVVVTTGGVFFSMFVMDSNIPAPGTITESGGVVIGEDEAWAGAGGAANYQIYSSGNPSITWTCNSAVPGIWTSVGVAFKAAAGAAASPKSRMMKGLG